MLNFTRAGFDALNEDALRRFVELQLEEGHFLDYKVALSGRSTKESYREFLKDITGFANASGGHLLIGVGEPEEGRDAGAQIVGVENGDDLAKDLERVAATSTEPRIPGLGIRAIQLATGRYVVLIQVPASMSRPHMVNHQGHRSFYIRHSESTLHMNSFDIREAVLSSATAEATARAYTDARRSKLSQWARGKPSMLLQAMPLIPIEGPWDTTTAGFKNIFIGHTRSGTCGFNETFELRDLNSGRPTIDGRRGHGPSDRAEPRWATEIHRNGYIEASHQLGVTPIRSANTPVVYDDHWLLFRSFCSICTDAWTLQSLDHPYAFRACILHAHGVVLAKSGERSAQGFTSYSDPFKESEMSWPDVIRSPGDDPAMVVREWYEIMSQAFGLDWKLPEAAAK